MIITRLSKRGNSTGLTVPRAYLAELAWGTGDHVVLAIQDGALVVRSLADHTARQASRRETRYAGTYAPDKG